MTQIKEPCTLCINWVNGNDCEISMPQEICPSRKELGEIIEAIRIYKQMMRTISHELDNPPMYFSALDSETREEIDVYPLLEVRNFMDRLKMALLSAKKEGEKI